ncbi:general secretion pathway protein GspB [Pseudoalteromonas mariniglutinosa]|uniref:general secretion pathway protein GspB n=1 Tax=Pseudoalteromonas mariniglutinosa TaxID=206042 RepID=UPI00384A7DFC
MSLLLDAIKQSDQHEQTAVDYDHAALQHSQQQQLKRYRMLAVSFGLMLALILTLVAGFAIGKWLQQHDISTKQVPLATVNDIETDNTALIKQEGEKKEQPTQSNNQQTSNQVLPQAIQQPFLAVQQGQQYQWIQVPVNTLPVSQGYQPHPVYQQQPVYQQPHYQMQPVYQGQPQPQNNEATNASSIDMSKYKVLGKPLNQQTANNESVRDEEQLNAVPDTLKNAFAQAIKDVDNKQIANVTRSTKNSSYAEPVELLPDSLQGLIPRIKYQAHIYASEPGKRWIKLNGSELYEGDNIGVLTVIEITPEQSLLSYDGYEFTLKALQDWPE